LQLAKFAVMNTLPVATKWNTEGVDGGPQ